MKTKPQSTLCRQILSAVAALAVLPAALQALHPRWGTPATALNASCWPLVAVGLALLHERLSASRIYDLLGGFGVLAFLLVYGLVAVAALGRPLQGVGSLRRRGVAGAALVAVVAVAAAFGSSLWNGQAGVLLGFTALLALGALLVLRRP